MARDLYTRANYFEYKLVRGVVSSFSRSSLCILVDIRASKAALGVAR